MKKYFNNFAVYIMMVAGFGCNNRHGRDEILQAETEAFVIKNHYEIYVRDEKKDPDPSDLADFIRETRSGDMVSRGWIFHEKVNPVIASKYGVLGSGGLKVDVSIDRRGNVEVKNERNSVSGRRR